MEKIDYVVIGAGPAGIAAARTLKDASKSVVIFEKQSQLGGLCGSFDVEGCTFDKFIHLSFAPESLRNKWFNSTPLIEHAPLAYNYYNGKWLKHPAINNLAPLSFVDKARIIKSFISRNRNTDEIANYRDWSEHVYGKYFTEKFAEPYTQKYWGVNTGALSTSWVGLRFHKPTLKEILAGAIKEQEESFFYAKKMYYPSKNPDKNGQSGYVQILHRPAEGLNIRYNHECLAIDPVNKIITVKTDNGVEEVFYRHLITTMPMPEIVTKLTTVNPIVANSMVKHFKHTTGIMVSLIFNHPKITDKLWFYVYDKNIMPARFYSPSLCCPENVANPGKQSALQGEIYFAESGLDDTHVPKDSHINNAVIGGLDKMGFDTSTLSYIDIRREKYANIIFDNATDIARDYVQAELDYHNIINCGRFGEWRYLWSHQAFASGIKAAHKSLSASALGL